MPWSSMRKLRSPNQNTALDGGRTAEKAVYVEVNKKILKNYRFYTCRDSDGSFELPLKICCFGKLEAALCVATHLWSTTLGAFLQSKVCESMIYSNSSTLSVA